MNRTCHTSVYNLTSDKETGLGNWTDDQIEQVITRGVRPRRLPDAALPHGLGLVLHAQARRYQRDRRVSADGATDLQQRAEAQERPGSHPVSQAIGASGYHGLHVTMLHLLGIDHAKLTYRFNGRDMRLTDVYGELIPQIVA